MSTTSATQSKKNNARKMAARSAQPAPTTTPKAAPQVRTKEVPMIDVPKVKGQHDLVGAFKVKHIETVRKYMTDNFEDISEADLNSVLQECAECHVQKRSPKAGGVWGDATTIIEDILTVVAEAVAAEPPPAPKAEPTMSAEDKAEFDQELADLDVDMDTSKPTIFKGKTKQAKKAKAAVEPKDKKKPSVKKTEPSVTTETDLADEPANSKKLKPAGEASDLKKLKGKAQWMAAVAILRKSKDIRIQAQDVEEVMTHLYEVSIGKAKLKEEGFDGKGEKCYRRNRLLGFKESIEALIKKASK